MQLNNGFKCDFENLEFIEMIASFKILVAYSLFLVEKKHTKETFLFFNFLFEKYFPEDNLNLGEIDYKKLFIGKYTEEMTTIYQKLLDLWMELQNKWSLSKEDVLKLRYIEKKVNELISK